MNSSERLEAKTEVLEHLNNDGAICMSAVITEMRGRSPLIGPSIWEGVDRLKATDFRTPTHSPGCLHN